MFLNFFKLKAQIYSKNWEKYKVYFIVGFVFLSFLGFELVGLFSSIIIIIFFNSLASRQLKALRLQQDLPTSKINSVSMGLAEIEGKIKYEETIISQVKNKKCAGYVYWIDEISHDDEGHEQFRCIHRETNILPFFLVDGTGQIKIMPDQIEVLDFKTYEYRSNNKRYSEHIIEEDNKEYIIIGRVDLVDEKPTLIYDFNKKTLSIFPKTAIENYDAFNKVFAIIGPFLIVFLLWIAFVLSSEVTLTDNGLSIVPHHYIKDLFDLL